MKTCLIALLIGAAALLSACGNDATIDGKHYQTYGIANMETQKDPNVLYEISAGSVIVAILFSETIIIPVYVVGWDLWQPVRKRAP